MQVTKPASNQADKAPADSAKAPAGAEAAGKPQANGPVAPGAANRAKPGSREHAAVVPEVATLLEFIAWVVLSGDSR